MKTPNIRDIITKLELVLENQLSREEVSEWAYKWMMISENEEGWETQIQPAGAERLGVEEPSFGANEAVPLTEGKGKADCCEDKNADDKVHQILHHDVGDAFCSCETGLNESKARLHEDDENGCNEYPDVVENNLDSFSRQRLFGEYSGHLLLSQSRSSCCTQHVR